MCAFCVCVCVCVSLYLRYIGLTLFTPLPLSSGFFYIYRGGVLRYMVLLSNTGVNLVRDGVSRKSLQRGAWGAFSPFEVTAFENLGERGGDGC